MMWTVSVKGVVLSDNAVLLALNDRNEWELPGGQLEAGETPEHCVVREIQEESSLVVSAAKLLDAWVFEVIPGRHVLIVAYSCELDPSTGSRPTASAEHASVRFVDLPDLDALRHPAGYRRAISLAQHG